MTNGERAGQTEKDRDQTRKNATKQGRATQNEKERDSGLTSYFAELLSDCVLNFFQVVFLYHMFVQEYVAVC